MSRELNHDELHPCECDERHAVLSNEDYEHVKRNYYEVTRFYFCRKCDCQWRIVEWCVENWYNHTYFTEYRKAELVQCLVTGADLIDQFNKRSFSYDNFKELFDSMIGKNNMFESMRFNKHMAPYTEQKQDSDGMEVKIL